ncbi:MAG: M23 family metallopeptidase [Dehalococcoidia bacterium]|nr:M23 family metallopeptidase [Dehalococcoidia bacterium]
MAELVFAQTVLRGANAVGTTIEGQPVTGPITQVFGQVSVTGRRHGGVDIAANEGTPVRAPAAGVLRRHSLAERAWEFGNWVLIDHPGTPWYSAYAHLSAFAAPEGEVAAGDIIGYVGQTGVAFGAHLHWAVGTSPWFALDFSQLRDPLDFVPRPPALEARVARLERVLAANGVRPTADPARLTGEVALRFIDERGHSVHLGLTLTQERVAALERRLAELEAQRTR